MLRSPNTAGQEAALQSVESGNNTFITGAGGVGKSYLIDQIRSMNGTAVTSTTAISAGNVKGVTLNSWAGLGLGLESANRMFTKLSAARKANIRRADRLVIDEVSMLHPDLMGKCDDVLQRVRGDDSPFGGLQVIAVGDFFQLPPVETRRGVDTEYAFECETWESLDFNFCELTEMMRQDDEEFQTILNAIRCGELDGVDLNPLLDTYIESPNYRKGEFTRLSARNKDVDAENYKILDKLPGESRKFVGDDSGLDFMLKQCRLPKTIELKVGALCLFLVNGGKLFNGSVVKVIDFYDDGPVVEDVNSKETFEIMPVKQEVYQGYEKIQVKLTETPEIWEAEDGEQFHESDVQNGTAVRPKVVASRRSIPLRHAWWMTIHKSQGMGISQLHAHVSSCFAPGHVYTALSRAHSLKGLTTSEIRSFSVSPQVQKYYKTNQNK
jgi:ATP-dependent DNA helicase PIF1